VRIVLAILCLVTPALAGEVDVDAALGTCATVAGQQVLEHARADGIVATLRAQVKALTAERDALKVQVDRATAPPGARPQDGPNK